MGTRALSWTAPLARWLTSRPYTIFGLFALLFVSVSFLRRGESEWENVYVQAAHNLRDGLDIYQPEISNLYPPFATLTALPFTWLSPSAQRALWLIVNLGCLIFLVRGTWRLADGRLEGVSRVPLSEHLAAIVGGLCGVCYLQNCLAHQQTDIVLGALLIGGCLALRRERSLVAATCFGLAAAVKCTPLLWAPYLMWRRRPLAAAWLLIVALGVNFLPDLVHPSATGRLWLSDYIHLHLRPMTDAEHYFGVWGSDMIYNQSIPGTGLRCFVTTWEWTPFECFIVRRPEALSPQTCNAIVVAIELLLILLTLLVCRRPFQRLPNENQSRSRRALEYSVVLLLMLLCSPMSGKAHFGLLMLPGFCLARAAFGTPRRWLQALLCVAVLLALVSNKLMLGDRLQTLTLWFGCVTWQTLLLLAGCLGLLAVADKAVAQKTNLKISDVAPRQAA